MTGKRIKVILNPDRPEDRRILDYLYYAGVPYSKAIKTAVLFYLDRETGDKEERLLQRVRDTIQESVRGLSMAAQSCNPAEPTATEEDEEPVSPLDFLDELEKGALF